MRLLLLCAARCMFDTPPVIARTGLVCVRTWPLQQRLPEPSQLSAAGAATLRFTRGTALALSRAS
ncbi:MAG TPA: hypothetical protein VJR89_42210 [Polyangiales bacterium]|nr:hypothetical protein [Polyangiales bacterium]